MLYPHKAPDLESPDCLEDMTIEEIAGAYGDVINKLYVLESAIRFSMSYEEYLYERERLLQWKSRLREALYNYLPPIRRPARAEPPLPIPFK